ncbi:hypothetical protein [Undibacterium sp. Xuan67W]|uniref:hypothetical protein n=1 Tax=Undibacterium sp. Xuan67W TaxID=3413057 RepID=UPI003BEF575A
MNQNDFPAPLPWSDYPQIDIESFREQFPEILFGYGRTEESEDDPWEAFCAEFEDASILLIIGQVHLTQAHMQELSDTGHIIVVDGDVDIEGDICSLLYVSGDIYCDNIYLGYCFSGGLPAYSATGKIVARHYAHIGAEDHEMMVPAPAIWLETPYLFSWFGNIDQLKLSSDTSIFIVGERGYDDGLDMYDAVFNGHDSVYVLKPEHASHLDSDGSDEDFWNLFSIRKDLQNGNSIFIEGFDPACMSLQRAGDDALSLNDYCRAYQYYKAAANISPQSYFALFGMAECLHYVHAYGQALIQYRAAASLMPAHQNNLINGALNDAAWCAVRSNQYSVAIELATKSIEFNQNYTNRGKEARGEAYRWRAEALYLMGEPTAAIADLKRALEFRPRHLESNWLMGLMYYLQGDEKLARSFHAKTCGKNGDLWLYYDQAKNTNDLNEVCTNVDWDRLSLSDFTALVKDETYWCDYIRNNGSGKLNRVPVVMRSAKLFMTVLQNEIPNLCGWAQFTDPFPDTAFTPEVVEYLVRCGGVNLRYVPKTMITKQLCMLANIEARSFDASAVPVEVFDEELCFHALSCGAALEDLPEHILSKELCLHAIRKNRYALEKIPAHLIDEECHLTAIVFSDPYFVKTHIAKPYKTPAMLMRAIDMDKRALDSIPGNMFDAELYKHAEARYGNDPDWLAIVARHDQASCDANDFSATCAEQCWSALWDEAFMLRHIAKEGYRLASYEIPKALYTEVIAQACRKLAE